LVPAAFSENLTVSGLHEANVHLGDILRAGQALVQVTYPRIPCTKLARKRRHKDLPVLIRANGLTGFYLRVLEPGRIAAGDALEVVERHPLAVSVLFTNEVRFSPAPDPASIERLLAVDAIGEALRLWLEKTRS
jgi:MOSC domain-containing protein YiiM